MKKLTDIVDRSTAPAPEVVARVLPVAPKARLVFISLESKVRALNSAALLQLTIGPDAPLAVVYMLTVLSADAPFPNIAALAPPVALIANRLTPLKVS